MPLALLGCAEVAGDEALRERPGIDIEELRCGPVEVASFGRAERFVPLPDGEVFLVGNSYNRFRQASGKVVQFDPTGARAPLSYSLGWPVSSLAYAEGGLITAVDGAEYYRWTRGDFDHPTHVASVNGLFQVTAVEMLRVGADDLVTGANAITDREAVPTVVRMDPLTGGVVWRAPYINNQGLPVIEGDLTSLAVHAAAGEIFGVGHGRPASGDPETYGFFLRFDAETGALKQHREFPQIEIEPQRLILDRSGEPVVLGIEGHEGVRYEHAKPFLARFGERGELVDKLPIALPDGTSQGALLAGKAMQDGGWLLGGSACGEDRTWCQAWLVRVDRAGEVIWSQMVARDVAVTVNDVHVVGNRVFAALSSSYYCCEFDEFDYDGWLWELDLDGNCPLTPSLKRDGTVFR